MSEVANNNPAPVAPPATAADPGHDPRKTRERVALGLVYVVLVIAAVITLIPFLYLIFSSFKSEETFASGPFWPAGEGGPFDVDWSGFTLENYRNLFATENVYRVVVNSFFYASDVRRAGHAGRRNGRLRAREVPLLRPRDHRRRGACWRW